MKEIAVQTLQLSDHSLANYPVETFEIRKQKKNSDNLITNTDGGKKNKKKQKTKNNNNVQYKIPLKDSANDIIANACHSCTFNLFVTSASSISSLHLFGLHTWKLETLNNKIVYLKQAYHSATFYAIESSWKSNFTHLAIKFFIHCTSNLL